MTGATSSETGPSSGRLESAAPAAGARWLDHPLKRLLDLAIAGPGLLLSLPVALLIALAVRLDSGGPVLFRQERLGRGGRTFSMLKFRTMDTDADDLLDDALARDENAEAAWKAYQKLVRDPRVTRVGRVLRRYSLDELPQLWNVLHGDMTLVGPRPILPGQRKAYGGGLDGYVRTRPGLTGLWQVSGRNRLGFEARVVLDERYRRCASPFLDLRILLRTVRVVATRDGAW